MQVCAEHQPHVVIIGGGITGLSAALALQQAEVRYTLVERDMRLGGKIRTEVVEHEGQFVVEAGPDSILAQKPAGVGLARTVGLQDRMIGNNQQRKTVYIYSRGRLVPMPSGLVLAVPVKLEPFLRSPLLSVWGRLRALFDLVLPGRRDAADESLGAFFRRRMGREMLERMVEPLMSGIHNAECERQSLLATFPRFHAVERKHGSLIRGLQTDQQAVKPTSAQPTSAFISFPGGLQELINATASCLQGNVMLGTGVQHVNGDVERGGYHVLLENNLTLHADAVIVATPAFVAAQMLEAAQPELAAQLRQIRYVSTGIVTMAFRAADSGAALDGTGILVPRVEKRQINAVTVSSVKWSGRAPDGTVLVRVFVGGSHHLAMLDMTDNALVALARQELHTIAGVAAEPLFAHVTRWYDANPQYDVGHLERVAALEAQCPDGLYLTGCAYRGVGIPDCIQQGQTVAAAIVEALAQTTYTSIRQKADLTAQRAVL